MQIFFGRKFVEDNALQEKKIIRHVRAREGIILCQSWSVSEL